MNALFLLALAAAPAQPPAALEASPAAADLGEVRAGPTLSQHFKLTNKGTRVLTVTEVRPGCGCLRPRLSVRTLLPGETAELVLDVNTLSQPAGANSWRMTVRYRVDTESGPSDGEQELRVTAKLVKELLIEPCALSLSGDGELTHTLTITSPANRPKPLSVTAVRTSAPHLRAELLPATADGEGRRVQAIKLTLDAAAPPGRRSETVAFDTDDPEYRDLRLPVRIEKRAPGRVTTSPEQLNLRLVPGQAAVSGLVRLRDAEDGAVVVERAESDSPAVKCRWAAGPGSMATLRVTVEAGQARGAGKAEVRVHIGGKAPQVVTVPVAWEGP